MTDATDLSLGDLGLVALFSPVERNAPGFNVDEVVLTDINAARFAVKSSSHAS